MNILLTIFCNTVPLQAYYDHLYKWFTEQLQNDNKINVKFLMIENYFKQNEEKHLLDNINPVKLENSNLNYIFNTSNFEELYYKIHCSGINENEKQRLKEIYQKKFSNWLPDIIVSLGYESASKIWHDIFPKALCLTQENAIFSRTPFKRTLSYDPYNSVPYNYLVRFSEQIKSFKITEEQNIKIEKLKKSIVSIINKHSEIDDEMFFYYKQKFDKFVLLPLIGNKYIELFKDCIYENEFEVVEQVLKNTPSNVGVFVTQHDSFASLKQEDIKYFSEKYSNFICLKKTNVRGYSNNSLQYFKYIDAVFNITSKTAFMALIWNKPVLSLSKTYNKWYQDGLGMEDINKVFNISYKNKNNILYWYLTRYVMFEQDFYKKNFIYDYLNNKLNKYRKDGINFEFFEEINSVDKIFDYIIKSIIEYYDTQKRNNIERTEEALKMATYSLNAINEYEKILSKNKNLSIRQILSLLLSKIKEKIIKIAK